MVHAVLNQYRGVVRFHSPARLVRERVDVVTFVEIAAVNIPSRFKRCYQHYTAR